MRQVRLEIMQLHFDANQALTEEWDLRNIRALAQTVEIREARPGLVKALNQHDWTSQIGEDGSPRYKEPRLCDLLLRLCREGTPLIEAWSVVHEFLEIGWGKAYVKSPKTQGYANLEEGETCVVIAVTPEQVNRYRDWLHPGPLPVWDRGSKTLTFKGKPCRIFKRYAASQYAILDAFQKEGWPSAVPIPGIMSRQTAADINSGLEPGSPLHFSISDRARTGSVRP